ncbi:glycosyltransferase family 4 protein [Alkalinema pantanalense CENA528]|uniref:glycosyltransferase family 4 protein n=1 Tax=Alkalinema pantanalense TaxID=1620705 RepID=UPI003D6E7460
MEPLSLTLQSLQRSPCANWPSIDYAGEWFSPVQRNPMFSVTIDATSVLPKPSGIGLYTLNLIQELDRLRQPENFELRISFQPSLKGLLKGQFNYPEQLRPYSPLIRTFPFPVRFSNWFLRFPQLFPFVESQFGKPDIYHGTNYMVFPFRHSKRVATVYDLTFIKYPQFATATVKAYAQQLRRCLRWTDLIVTISESSKRDIVEYLGFPADRIVTTYPASRLTTADIPSPSAIADVPYPFSKPYILFVSTIEPRKNIATLIQAFEQLKARDRINHDLVLIGQKGWLYESIFDQITRSPYRDQIHHLSYLSDAAVAYFLAQANVFVYPSLYEGFGLPVLEAMTLGAPVVTSNTSSIPEVAGNAALLVDPQDVDALSHAIGQVIGDRTLRQQLITQGYQQATKFSWAETAKQTLNAYRLLA